MWAMIPMFRVFSSVNLRGMGRVSLCLRLLAFCPGAGEKNGPGGPVTPHGERPEILGYVSRISMRGFGPDEARAQTCSAPRRSLMVAASH